ncbi:FAD-binding protein [Pseudonocardia sp. CA-107938]|uniref:FAD-binding protein n=1 Tax=Pseudonocardia sp. CA-107938 TaxID=3240021 RepID=UPI003D89B3CB
MHATREHTPQDLSYLVSITTGDVTADATGQAVTVAAANAADVVGAVAFAAEFGLPLAIDVPGAPAAKGGLLISTERLRGVHVDRVARTAIAQVGALWSDVVDRAREHGLAPLVPRHDGTGILGSGYGWSAGHVLGIDAVTRDGRYRHVAPAADPRLFRRLCAVEPGDVEPGVVVAMTFTLFR